MVASNWSCLCCSYLLLLHLWSLLSKVIINVVMQAPFLSASFKVKGGKENEVTCRDIGADKISVELGQKFY